MEKLACNSFKFSNSLLLHFSPSTTLPPAIPRGATTESSVETHQQAVSRSSSSSRTSSSGSISVHGKLNSLDSVKQLHAQFVKSPRNRNSDAVVRALISAYLKFRDFTSSAMVFLTIEPGRYRYESFLGEYEGFGGDPHHILEVFGELYGKGVEFNSWAVALLLRLCTVLMDTWLGLEVHACLVKRGFNLDANVKTALMEFYKTCCNDETAERVSDKMPIPRVPSGKVRIAAGNTQSLNPEQSQLEGTRVSSVKPDSVAVIKALQECGKNSAINEGKKIHGYVVRHYLEKDIGICNSLISMYSKNSQIALSRRVFDLMGKLSLLSTWNSMISAYASLGYFDDAWQLVGQMNRSRNVKPDEVTWNSLLINYFRHGSYKQVLAVLAIMVSVNIKPSSRAINPAIQAATELNLIDKGRELHGYAVRTGRLDCDEYTGAILVDMYIKIKTLDKAKSVFDLLINKDIVTWNSMIYGYASKGQFDEATKLVDKMKEEGGIRPDIYTYNGLIAGYAMNGLVDDATSVLHQMKTSGLSPGVISYTAIISGCSKSGKYVEAFRLFNQMLEKGIKPKPATMLGILQSCAGLSLLQTGKEIHCMCTRNGFMETNTVATATIDMYVKSGSLDMALKIFWTMKEEKTVGTWNCMIMGLAIHSRGQEAIELFDKMQLQAGLKPDAVTFTAILSSCKNSGLVDMGWKYFDSMKSEYNITPTIEHYSCMVDLLGRSGYLDEAWDFIQKMPVKPEASTWGSLLRSCLTHNHLQLGEIAAEKLFELEPTKSTNYVLLMNLYSRAAKWREVERLQETLNARGLKPLRSWSWVQLDRKGHVFFEDETHPDEGEVYFELYQLISEMRKVGYVPDTKCVYQNISDGEKEKILMNHPEKLAITYGLIKKGSGSGPIRVVKSSRMCGDCHSAAKFISLVRNCVILLKDGIRFHHFKDGRCSCNDYW